MFQVSTAGKDEESRTELVSCWLLVYLQDGAGDGCSETTWTSGHLDERPARK